MEGEHKDNEVHEEAEGEGEQEYHWPALESDPQIFTDYMRNLGMGTDWQICEVFGLDDDCLGFVPTPCLAAIVTFDRQTKEDSKPGDGDDSKIVKFYMKQTGTLDNACGIVACLHAIMNHTDDIQLDSNSVLEKFRRDTKQKSPQERAEYLEEYK